MRDEEREMTDNWKNIVYYLNETVVHSEMWLHNSIVIDNEAMKCLGIAAEEYYEKLHRLEMQRARKEIEEYYKSS
jgi:hypothetical protein